LVFVKRHFPVESESSGVKPANREFRFVGLYFVARFKVDAFYFQIVRLPVDTNGKPIQWVYCHCYSKIKTEKDNYKTGKQGFM